MLKKVITKEHLQDNLSLDEKTGKFYWKKVRRRVVRGQFAGYYRKDGYYIICINGIDHYGHHLVYLWYTGDYPEYLDHVDNNPTNNVFTNLRKSTHQQNMHNQGLSKANTTGIKGICWVEGTQRYIASIKSGNTKITKSFSVHMYCSKANALAAAAKYIKQVREELHGEYANHG